MCASWSKKINNGLFYQISLGNLVVICTYFRSEKWLVVAKKKSNPSRIRTRSLAYHGWRNSDMDIDVLLIDNVMYSDSGSNYQPPFDEDFEESRIENVEEGNEEYDDFENIMQNEEIVTLINGYIGNDPIILPFTGDTGIKIEIPTTSSGFEIFQLFFDEAIINKIVDWTNSRTYCLLTDLNLKRASN